MSKKPDVLEYEYMYHFNNACNCLCHKVERTWFDEDINKYINHVEKQLQEQCIINLSQAEQADEVREEKKALIDFCIWMTGCGYDFTKHKYFIKQRDKLLKP